MTRKTQRQGASSTAKKVQAYQSAKQSIPVPEGIELKTEQEAVVWDQFTRARSPEDWRDFDLLLVYKMVKIETQIREHDAALYEQGVVLENKRGTQIVNPLLNIVDTLQRQQLALIRSMSLTQTASDPRQVNASAKQDAKAIAQMKKAGPLSLIAMPNG